MKFSQLAEYFEQLEALSSRLEITKLLAEVFSQLSPQEMCETAYLLQGRVAPLYVKSDFGMAEKMVVKALATAFQIDNTEFTNELKKRGDLGSTVEYFRAHVSTLDEGDPGISETFAELSKIPALSGPGSQEGKQKLLARIILESAPKSAKYLVRIPIGVMRLGLSDMTVLDAYSWMLTGGKSLRKQIEAAYHVRPDLGFIGRTLKEEGIDGLKDVKPVLFTPILMMRAERLSSGEEILEKIGRCAVEPKFDGFRLQVHYSKKENKVVTYTRGLESVMEAYPDVVAATMTELDVDSIIFEGEAIGYVPETDEFLPFQMTVSRKRKHDIEEQAKLIPLKMFTFDLLFLNGKSYIDEPYSVRREMIEKVITSNDKDKKVILAAESTIFENGKEIELKFEDSIAHGLEGIVAKKLDGVYQAGARGFNWVKFKRSYASSSLNDTIDVVVMGYDFGKGKRTEFGIGAFLVGVYNGKKDMYETVAKIGTGLTDDEWREMKKRADALKVKEKPSNYDIDKLMNVDVLIAPEIVVEILADEITRSPMHTAGRTLKASKSGKAFEVDEAGFALRFPRLQKFRDDKTVGEITTLQEVSDIFNKAIKK